MFWDSATSVLNPETFAFYWLFFFFFSVHPSTHLSRCQWRKTGTTAAISLPTASTTPMATSRCYSRQRCIFSFPTPASHCRDSQTLYTSLRSGRRTSLHNTSLGIWGHHSQSPQPSTCPWFLSTRSCRPSVWRFRQSFIGGVAARSLRAKVTPWPPSTGS